jgi:hypothetical protein
MVAWVTERPLIRVPSSLHEHVVNVDGCSWTLVSSVPEFPTG